MARSKITETKENALTDSGGVLWSFVKGEQLEFPILLNFLTDATVPGYQFEAVVVEALNVAEQLERPLAIKPAGIQTVLNIRLPVVQGVWSPSGEYNAETIVSYNGKYYSLTSGFEYSNAVSPDLDPLWEETSLNRVFIQFPSSLGSTWTVAPGVTYNTYGFFELRVTEPSGLTFRKTWKPIRGMVELLFSPTDIVPDV
jgi:hypothetical protein